MRRARDCPTCGKAVGDDARFCPECGRPLSRNGGQPDASAHDRRGHRLRRVGLLVLVALALVAGAVVLLVGDEWGWALAALLGAVVAALALGRSRGGAGRFAVSDVRARLAAAHAAMAARSREQVELFRARRELADLEAERSRLFRELGVAVYHGDEEGKNGARASLDDVGERMRRKESEIEALRREREERVRSARSGARPTERLETPPEPARVPEPWPPPDEGDLPDPAPTPAPGEPAPGPGEPAPPQGPTGDRPDR